MTKRIFLSILAVSLSVLLVSFFGMFVLLYQTYSQIEFQQLTKQAELIAGVVEETGDRYLPVMDDTSYRLNLISNDGEVLYDSSDQPEAKGNHLYREEIQQALKEGVGQSVRYSSTLASETFYTAQKLKDGSFIRISVTMASIYGLLTRIIAPFFILLAAVIVLSMLLANRLSRSIVSPILNIDLDHPLGSCSYPQIQPLLERIDRSNQQIMHQMEELRMKSREFETVSNNMDEGLILLSEAQDMISCNQAARLIFEIQDGWKPDDLPKLSQALRQVEKGERGNFSLHKKGRDYVVEVNLVAAEREKKGYIILALDTTEKVEAQKRRQEFTANVTHELKTPIQTIMASTELLQAGLVKKEDQSRFLKYISREANRLVEMINDIIQLSRLDAGNDEPVERVDLTALIENQADSMEPACESRGIALRLDLEELELTGSVKTWQSIFGNLMENALKYNKDGGSIDVRLWKEPCSRAGQIQSDKSCEDSLDRLAQVKTVHPEKIDVACAQDAGKALSDQNRSLVCFEVRDTGIGIPEKYQERVFERFFRVDKSHSKKVGGSGLGLAIVNHAVQYMQGTISLQSEENTGTVIKIAIPCVLNT